MCRKKEEKKVLNTAEGLFNALGTVKVNSERSETLSGADCIVREEQAGFCLLNIFFFDDNELPAHPHILPSDRLAMRAMTVKEKQPFFQ